MNNIKVKVHTLHHSPSREQLGSEIPEVGWPTDVPARLVAGGSMTASGWEGGVVVGNSRVVGKSM